MVAAAPTAPSRHASKAVRPLPAAPVFNLLHDAAAKYGHRPAMDFFGKRWTYTETAALAAKAAQGFQKIGVTKGTRVGLLLPFSLRPQDAAATVAATSGMPL